MVSDYVPTTKVGTNLIRLAFVECPNPNLLSMVCGFDRQQERCLINFIVFIKEFQRAPFLSAPTVGNSELDHVEVTMPQLMFFKELSRIFACDPNICCQGVDMRTQFAG